MSCCSAMAAPQIQDRLIWMDLGSAMHNPVGKRSVLPLATCPAEGAWPGSGASLLPGRQLAGPGFVRIIL